MSLLCSQNGGMELILQAEYQTVHDGFNWYGLEVEEQENNLVVCEGRIGLSDNPIIVTDNIVSGGWYVPYRVLNIKDDEMSVDILLDRETETCVFMVRHNTGGECYNDTTHLLLLSLAYRQSLTDPWLIATPLRGEYDEKNG